MCGGREREEKKTQTERQGREVCLCVWEVGGGWDEERERTVFTSGAEYKLVSYFQADKRIKCVWR